MALFTTADRDAVKVAMVKLVTNGIASMTIGGQSVTVKTVEEAERLLKMINADLASDQTHFGLKMVTLVPPGAG
jgi:tryptophanase